MNEVKLTKEEQRRARGRYIYEPLTQLKVPLILLAIDQPHKVDQMVRGLERVGLCVDPTLEGGQVVKCL
jgi:hypothetical protein